MHQSLHLLRRHARVHRFRRRSRTVPITTHAQVPPVRTNLKRSRLARRRRGEPESRHRLVIPGVFPDVFRIRGRVTIQIEPSLFRPHSRPRGRERDAREDHQRRRDDGEGAPATPRGSSARRVDVPRRARGLRVVVGRREKLRAFLARHRARRRENPRGADCRDGRSGSRARFGVETPRARARDDE